MMRRRELEKRYAFLVLFTIELLSFKSGEIGRDLFFKKIESYIEQFFPEHKEEILNVVREQVVMERIGDIIGAIDDYLARIK